MASNGITLIQVDGELIGEGVAELERACETIDGRLELDLTNLRAADTVGLQRIRTLAQRGARLVGVSPYIALLLDRKDGARRGGT